MLRIGYSLNSMFCLKQGTVKKGVQCLRKLQLARLFTQNGMSQYGIVSRKSVHRLFFRRVSALQTEKLYPAYITERLWRAYLEVTAPGIGSNGLQTVRTAKHKPKALYLFLVEFLFRRKVGPVAQSG